MAEDNSGYAILKRENEELRKALETALDAMGNATANMLRKDFSKNKTLAKAIARPPREIGVLRDARRS